MTPDQFRRLALALPDALESAHMGTPDFRVRGTIFATLHGGDEPHGVVKLSLEQQELFMRVDPVAFEPVAGAWGRKGWTRVRLRQAKQPRVRDALVAAWRNTAPKRLAAMLADDGGPPS